MDSERFDQFTKSFSAEGTRRSLFSGLARGGLATWLAGLGLLSLDGESAEAVNCGRRCRRHKQASAKRRCRRNCKRANQRRIRNRRRAHIQNSTAINIGPIGLGGVCAVDANCASGNCTLGFCAECTGVRLCGDRCCTVTATCLLGLCIRL